MKWCRFENKGAASFGIIEGDDVIAVNGSPFENYQKTDQRVPLKSASFLVPVVPPTFYAAGLNYREHVIEQAAKRGEQPKFPPEADIGYRANNALVGDGEPIVIPKDASEMVQYEGELVAVIAKKCRNVSEADALNYVFGYTIGNDVSERKWQRGDRTLWRGKNADTFKPMGPWIVTGLDPAKLECTVRLNGKVVAHYRVADAIFSLQTFIARMTQYMTLYAGDVIWMGTDGAPENMKHGDVCEVEIPGIGVLRNPVVREGQG